MNRIDTYSMQDYFDLVTSSFFQDGELVPELIDHELAKEVSLWSEYTYKSYGEYLSYLSSISKREKEMALIIGYHIDMMYGIDKLPKLQEVQ